MKHSSPLFADPVHHQLEESARHLVAEAGRLLDRLETARLGATIIPIGEAGADAGPAPPRLAGADFSPFHTGFEREQIDAAGLAFARVSESIRKCDRRLAVIPKGTSPLDLTGQAALLVEAACSLGALVTRLQHLSDLDRARQTLKHFDGLEARCNELATESLRTLYAGSIELGRLLTLKSLIDLLDAAVEDSIAAAHLLWRMMLRNN